MENWCQGLKYIFHGRKRECCNNKNSYTSNKEISNVVQAIDLENATIGELSNKTAFSDLQSCKVFA